MKIQKFINFLLTQLFFYVSSLDISQTVTPKSINHSNDHNSRSKHDNQENDPIFFHLLFKFYPLVYFIFVFQDLQNSVPWNNPFALISGL